MATAGAPVVHEVTPDLRVRVVRPMPVLATSLDGEVERLWQAAQARLGGRLFNGQVFNADVIAPHLVCGHWTEFRRVVAQMARPELHPLLGVRPMAVGGVILGGTGDEAFVIFGRRPIDAIYQAGQWQLPPAGSLDPHALADDRPRGEGAVDVMRQFHIELEEEVGLTAQDVHAARPLCIVEHPGSHVLDLGVCVRTDCSAETIRTAHSARANAEYAALEMVRLRALKGFLACVQGSVTLQAPIFLNRALGSGFALA